MSPVIGNLAEHRPSVHSVLANFLIIPRLYFWLYASFTTRKFEGTSSGARSIQQKFKPVREKRTASIGGPVFSKLFQLDRTDPLSFGPKFPETLVEWIAPRECKKPCICMCVLCWFTLQKPNTNTLLDTDNFYRKKLKYRSQTTDLKKPLWSK